jgi:hypothetical protein
MLIPHSEHIEQAYAALHCATFARRATVYVSGKVTIKLTRQWPHRKRSRQETFLLTIGAPNYREREFIRKMSRQGPFTLPHLHTDMWPKKRKAKAKAKK